MKIYKNINKIFILCLITFIITSLGDIITTYIGLNNGFAEHSPLVRFFWYRYNIIGLVMTKFISLFSIVFAAAIFRLGYELDELDGKQNIGKITIIYGFIFGSIIYGLATIININVLM